MLLTYYLVYMLLTIFLVYMLPTCRSSWHIINFFGGLGITKFKTRTLWVLLPSFVYKFK